jgi:hypothetical protein
VDHGLAQCLKKTVVMGVRIRFSTAWQITGMTATYVFDNRNLRDG